MEIPDPPWRSPARRRPAKPPLSQELIVDTAMAILAKEGLDAVSMRRVAQALNTGAASLYAHVRNREELYELMVDRVLGEVRLPEPDPARWREQLKEVLRGQARVMIAHPGIAKAAAAVMIPLGANALRNGEAILAILVSGGLTQRQAAFASDALTMYVKAFAVEASLWTYGEVDQEEAARRGAQMVEYMASLPPEMFPNMLATGSLFSAETAQERFDFALDMMINGLAALVGEPENGTAAAR